MSQNLSIVTDRKDSEVIMVNSTIEINYWAKELNVGRPRLKDAIKAVGPMVKDAKAWLARNSG